MSPFPFSKNLSLQALGTLILGFTGTIILFLVITNLENSRSTFDFQRRAENRISAVRNGLQMAEDNLATVNRLFTLAGPISPDQFRAFVEPMLERNAYIQNFTFHRLISEQERPLFEKRMREFYPNFLITEVLNGKIIPVRQKENYRVIEYVEPFQGNEAAFGLDATSRQSQDAAALRACQTGLVSATKPYVLVHRNLTMRGFVMLAPVYRANTNLQNVNTRCNLITGYTSAVFDTKRLVEQALSKRDLLKAEGYAVAVYSGDAENENDLIFRSEDTKYSATSSILVLPKFFALQPVDRRSNFEIAGLRWNVVVSSTPLPFFKYHLASFLTLLGGILASFLAAAYMQALVVRAERARQFNQESLEKSRLEQIMRDRNLQLEEERAHLRTLFDQTPSFIAILTGPQHIYEISNRSYDELVGHRNLIGKSVREALPELEGQGFYELLDRVYETAEPYIGKNLPIVIQAYLDKPAETRYVDFIYQPMFDAEGQVTAIFVQGNDISLYTKAQRELEHLVGHDALTGLPNDCLIAAELSKMMTQAELDQQSLVIMVVDIDRFNSVGERFGPAVANSSLKTIADRLHIVCRNDGVAGRLGGDKFLLVLQRDLEDSTCSHILQRIRTVIGEAIIIDHHELFLTCSIGIATYPTDATSPNELIQYAEMAMSGAKALGNNNFKFYTPELNERIRERLKLETAMRSALERSEFVVHYQPQLDLYTGKIVAVEALVRWQHPELGLVSPNSFIAAAEDIGLIVPLGEWVLKTACAQMKAWQKKGIENLRVAVNLSARQFAQGNLVEMIRTTLSSSGLEARYLDLELTESLVMTDVEYAIGSLKELNDIGVQLSIDDFGTGYSSLAYLKRFPIDVLKIDRSFIKDIPQNSNDAAIADAIISMAHSLGMRVLAEGVETEAQCEFLSRNMCDEVQGFLFSKALSAEEMEPILRESPGLPAHLLRLHKPARKLLLVDDEPSILSSLKRLLRQDGYHIITAADGQAGLDVLAQTEVDVIVSDQRMPGMTGVEFLRKVKTLYPHTVRIVLSGFTELKSVTDAVNEGAIYKFLTKPWEDDQLRGHIAEAFQHKEMADENRRLDIQVRTTNQELASANRKLEEALQYKQQQIQRREVSLDIVREALQHVPLPIIGLDEEEVAVFANGAAYELFEKVGLILGDSINQIIPEFSHPIPEHKTEEQYDAMINGLPFQILARRMGQGTQSRGSLIILKRLA
ncbi:EAL domain-containing protein [Herminiimonas fonticola]|uniref:Diguanylate cyclase (GGDEF)-like protein n=1 Tax=Herminiimonas fonticola TaxID=303380 RepID=A0A4R6G065_9BURK|nr:EAL domain-containing protein [Herminiimonas fonticola]RBA22890.1 GGDEF: diguanylate cyclase (GGDEF) domain [Herminiimonas fonticola]TDN87686.1 diguanylate cyclase (GGDEF)-like protein [Herminiimonas fonticola]